MDFINIIKKQDFFSLKEYLLEKEVSSCDIEFLEDNPYLLLRNFNIYIELRKKHNMDIHKIIDNSLILESDLSLGIEYLLEFESIDNVREKTIYLILKNQRNNLFKYIVLNK